MSRNRSDLIARVLSRLGITGSGEDISPEDSAKVDDEIDGILAELAAQDIVNVPDADEIDDAVFGHLSAIIADEVADDFGIPDDEAAKIATRRTTAEVRLRRLQPEPAVYVPMRGEYW